MKELKALTTARVVFLAEQDGPVERYLKASLSNCLSLHKDVKSAYLVRVSYEEAPGANVALCLCGGFDNRDALLCCVGAEFRKQFSSTQHLDTLFLTEPQIDAIERVAKPFYLAS